jgi:hypothetical protein
MSKTSPLGRTRLFNPAYHLAELKKVTLCHDRRNRPVADLPEPSTASGTVGLLAPREVAAKPAFRFAPAQRDGVLPVEIELVWQAILSAYQVDRRCAAAVIANRHGALHRGSVGRPPTFVGALLVNEEIPPLNSCADSKSNSHFAARMYKLQNGSRIFAMCHTIRLSTNAKRIWA